MKSVLTKVAGNEELKMKKCGKTFSKAHIRLTPLLRNRFYSFMMKVFVSRIVDVELVKQLSIPDCGLQ